MTWHPKIAITMNMLCFCEKWWIVKLWFDELGMNSWIIVLMMFENMLLMNWYDEYAIGELIMKVVVDVEFFLKV